MTNRYLIHQGDTLRTLRRERGLSLREVSAQAYTSLGYLSEIETARKHAHPDVIQALCDLYEMRYSDFLRRVADSMDLFEADVLQWQDANTMPTDRLPTGPRAR